jgi:predicted DsbA family dithiol-disulfide isomerase
VSEIEITYLPDVLCVWAYVAQARIEAVKEKFGKSVRIEHRFCSVFGDTTAKIARPARTLLADAELDAQTREIGSMCILEYRVIVAMTPYG